MKHFSNINSLGELKKQYRALAKKNHPDLGGSTEVMQEITAEFSVLYEIWKDRTDVANNGYDCDYQGATSKQYADYVYNEYKWKGSNFDWKLSGNDLGKIFRKWVKETYPNCKFSIRQGQGGWTKSFHINLYEADFQPFVDATKTYASVNHYHLNNSHDELTDRAIEVMENVINFIESYNYDESDIMTDYFNVNFYSDYTIGSFSKNFKYMPKALKSNKPIAKKKIGVTQKAINEAMKGCKWCLNERYSKSPILCLNDDSDSPYAKYSNNYNLIPNKVEKLRSVGLLVHIEKNCIVLDGMKEEVKNRIEEEKRIIEDIECEERHKSKVGTLLTDKENRAKDIYAKYSFTKHFDEVDKKDEIKIIDYSDKSFAVIGDTKPIKEDLKKLGGRFNKFLTCGAGWVFSNKRKNEVCSFFESCFS